MMPMLATVRIEGPDHPPIKVWAPLILVWILVLPILVILSPLILLVCLAMGLNPFRIVAALAEFAAAGSGTVIEIEAPDASVNIHLY